MTAEDMKAILCAYWRFVRHYPFVATETTLGSGSIMGMNPTDVIAITKDLYVYEIEVKTSVADLRREIRKSKYRSYRTPEGIVHSFPDKYSLAKYFYFAVPEEIAGAARRVVEELYKGAGLLVIRSPRAGRVDTYHEIGVNVLVAPRPLLGAKPVTVEQAYKLLPRIMNQMCRSMAEAANYRMGDGDRVAELADMILMVDRECGPHPSDPWHIPAEDVPAEQETL